MASQQILLGAGGAPKKTYIDDVFRVMPYRGNGSSTTRTLKGPKMSQGGMTAFKRLDSSSDGWRVLDTERGNTKQLYFHSSSAQATDSNGYYGGLGWTASGVNIASTSADVNAGDAKHAIWQWKKHENFFDVVTYTGNGSTDTGSSSRAIAHNLGKTPGMIWVKCLNDNVHWTVYHRNAGDNHYLSLSANSARVDNTVWGDYSPTSTHFYVSEAAGTERTNKNNNTYVAYIFASHHNDDGTFGEAENEKICYAGSYTGNGNEDGPEVDIGFVPQHLMVKRRDGASDWEVFDNMLGTCFGSGSGATSDQYLKYNTYAAANNQNSVNFCTDKDFTGFRITSDRSDLNTNGDVYIFYAVRGHDGQVVKPCEAGTELLSLKMGSNNTGTAGSSSPYFEDQPTYESTLTGPSKRIDYAWVKDKTTTSNWWVIDRNIHKKRQNFENGSDVDAYTDSSDFEWAFENGFNNGGVATNWMSWGWQKSDCFDVLHYHGAETTNGIKHRMGRVPSLILVQALNQGYRPMFRWGGNQASDEYITTDSQGERDDLTSPGHPWGNAPTTTHVYLGNNARTNHAGAYYRMCLWADKPGIQKAGSYTGDGTANQTITLGFQPRFIMLINEDGGCNWRMFDTVSGWGSGGDHHWAFNQKDGGFSTNYNFGSPTSTGFNIDSADSCHNDNGDKFFYLACA